MDVQSSRGISVLVLADPGLCVHRAQSIQERFEAELTRVFGSATVHVQPQLLGINDSNTLEFATIGSTRADYEHVDVLLMITEMPRHADGKTLIAEIFPEVTAAVLSYPTIGVLAGRQQWVSLLMACAVRLVDGATDEDLDRYTLRWNRWTEPTDGRPGRLHAHAVTGVPRTIVGMVATNAPWRAAPQLSSALAAASAAGAFGIFYNSIWQMSAALSTARLLLIGLLAISLMVLWLLASNRLWERPVQDNATAVLVYYNLSTVLTLFLCVLALYLALFAMILGASLVMIDPGFMAEILGQPARFARYVDIAWLSATLGVVAGGLGATFDDSTDLRQLTHGSRENQRRPSNKSGA